LPETVTDVIESTSYQRDVIALSMANRPRRAKAETSPTSQRTAKPCANTLSMNVSVVLARSSKPANVYAHPGSGWLFAFAQRR
jgi:hypothetical protein